MKRSHWPLSPRRPRSPSSFTSSSSVATSRNPSFSEGSSWDNLSTSLPSSSTPNLKAFTFTELKEATRDFCPDTAFDGSDVYEGWIDEQTLSPSKPGTGMRVAVKILLRDEFPGQQEWLKEVYYLSHLCHPNLVKLLGLCSEDDNRLLVYEMMPNINLRRLLFSRLYQPLSWAMRISIAIGAAKGLSFLHEKHIVHRDVKASNILLDSEFNAKLSSFYCAIPSGKHYESHIADEVLGTYGYKAPKYTAQGPKRLPWPERINLAMMAVNKCHESYFMNLDVEALDILLDSRHSEKQSGLLGNLNNGYAAPEYRKTGSASPECDVYSFGVLLLELLSGRQVIDTNISVERNLVDYAKRFFQDKQKIFKIIDLKLEGQYLEKDAATVAKLALRCLHDSPDYRPSMSDILAVLERLEGSRAQQNFNIVIA